VSLILVSGPEALPISLAELKAQVRYFEPDEDALLAGYIRSATDHIEATTGLRLITQTWAYSVDGFPCRSWEPGYIRLPIAPVQAITSISYLNTAGTPTVLAPGIYSFRGDRITLAPNATWPSIWYGLDVITIEFTVGYGPDHNYVPESLRHAIALLAAYGFEQRTAAAIGPDYGPVSEVPFGVRQILDGYRLWSV
jgi:uncharacterized phiE125 gp8 family phage protein